MTRPSGMTKTAYQTIKHLQHFGGQIVDNALRLEERYFMTWLVHRKYNRMKGYTRTISQATFEQIKPYLTLIADNDSAWSECYELNTQGHALE